MIPRLAEGATVVCIASGPSLTTEDVQYVRGKAIVIAINDAVLQASDPPVMTWKGYEAGTSWADVVYSSDQIWWSAHYRTLRTFQGLKVRVHAKLHKAKVGRTSPLYCAGCDRRLTRAEKACWCEGITTFGNAGERGVCFDPVSICTAENSGGGAINAAVHLGAKRIVLLGYDMGIDERGRRHFYDTGPAFVNSPFLKFRKLIATMAGPLRDAGIEVLNCSRRSALDCFPLASLTVLQSRAA